MYAGVGSGSRFRKVPEVSGELRCVLVAGFGRFRRVPVWLAALQS